LLEQYPVGNDRGVFAAVSRYVTDWIFAAT
jgi:hypothetical protein